MSMKAVQKINLPFLYMMVVIWVSTGVIITTGFRHVFWILMYLIVFTASYYLIRKIRSYPADIQTRKLSPASEKWIEFGGILIMILGFLFIPIHFSAMSQIPVWEAWKLHDSIAIALLRQNITASQPGWLNYLSSFSVKAILPFTLLFLYFLKSKKLFWVCFSLALLYSVNFLQKSYLVSLLGPLLVWLTLSGFYKKASLFIAITLIGISFLTVATNPQLRGHVPVNQIQTPDFPVRAGILGLFDRVVVIPGKMVSDWFDHIPGTFEYAKGCGYNFMSPILGCEFINYQRLIYDQTFPDLAAQGLQGTSNAASFMYEYANFGYSGLVLSAVLLSLLFNIIEWVFQKDRKMMLSLNILPILLLSSQALSTLLFSGGWALTILLFYSFRNRLIRADIS
jgi:hypothetical protein